MAKVQGTFFGESRIFTFPMFDFNGVPANSPVNPAQGQNPLVLSDEGDGTSWRLYGHSALVATAAAGGLPSNTPINFNWKRLDIAQDLIHQSQQGPTPATNINLGAPLEHLCGKAGNPAYMSYAIELPAGTKLLPTLTHQAAATPTGRSPLYITAHCMLRRPSGPKVQIGSKNAQQEVYRGEYAYFTGRLVYTTNNLGVNGSDTLIIPVGATKYFFIDSLWCRAISGGSNLPVSELNPLIAEQELLVSLRDTSNQAAFTVNGHAPLWNIFGPFGARYYHPPTMFVVRPRGNIELNIKNGPTAAVDYNLEFTFGGVLVDKDAAAVQRLALP